LNNCISKYFIFSTGILLVFQLLFYQGCTRIPLVPVPDDTIPYFTDDLDFLSLQQSLKHSLQYLQNQNQNTEILIANKTYTVADLKNSLEVFLGLLDKNLSSQQLNTIIKKRFDVYQASGVSGLNIHRTMLVTGYYQPIFPGSLIKKHPYIFPLYSTPSDLVEKRKSVTEKKQFGRFENNHFVPYWSRKEIETLNKAVGHELVWLQNPIDSFIIHIQGSALIRLEDNTLRGVHYARPNGRQYSSIGKFMVETGRMTLEEASMDAIRTYLTAHPEERNEILHHNESFIFFDWTKNHDATGSLGKKLTAGRSIAADQTCFPAGGLGFLISRQPVLKDDRIIGWKPLTRFVTVQDKGSAIRGSGRVDLFFGKGDNAGTAAGHMKEEGNLYFLLLKK
jgi:membrane-bound lytic murein transglycosylase A